jgi:hypothetical protein
MRNGNQKVARPSCHSPMEQRRTLSLDNRASLPNNNDDDFN